MPVSGSRNQMRLHCEQRYSMNDFEMVQSWVTANAIKVGDGTLRVIVGSHKLHAEFRNAFRTGKVNSRNWHSLTEHQIDWLIKRGCRDILIVAPSGSQVRIRKNTDVLRFLYTCSPQKPSWGLDPPYV